MPLFQLGFFNNRREIRHWPDHEVTRLSLFGTLHSMICFASIVWLFPDRAGRIPDLPRGERMEWLFCENPGKNHEEITPF